MQILRAGTFDGLFLTSDAPIVPPNSLSFFELRGASKGIIPSQINAEPNLLVRSTGPNGYVFVSAVFFAKDRVNRGGFFSVSVFENTKKVEKNLEIFIKNAFATLVKEAISTVNTYRDRDTFQLTKNSEFIRFHLQKRKKKS